MKTRTEEEIKREFQYLFQKNYPIRAFIIKLFSRVVVYGTTIFFVLLLITVFIALLKWMLGVWGL